MTHNPEKTNSKRNGSENRETKQIAKHNIQLELENNHDVKERYKWLEHAFEVDTATVVNGSVKRDILSALEQWEKELPPNHQEVIQNIRNKRWQEKVGGACILRSLPALIKKSFNSDDKVNLARFQSFGRDLIYRYRGNPEKTNWEDLPEQHKRFVRLGEMSVLAVDSLQAQSEMASSPQSGQRFQKLARILEKYNQSADVPGRFKEIYAYPIVRSVTGRDPKKVESRREAERSQERMRQYEGSTLHDLWGQPLEEQVASGAQPAEVKSAVSGLIQGSEGLVVKDKDGDVLDMEYNPESDSFEPVENNSKGSSERT